MITSNVIHRTFHIRYGSGTGTMFSIDRDGRQYLITAKHVVEGIVSGGSISVFHDKQWRNTTVEVVGMGAGGADDKQWKTVLTSLESQWCDWLSPNGFP